MNMLPAVRALKFFDLEPESRVRIWFVVLTGMFAAGFLAVCQSDFAPLIERLIAFSEGRVALPGFRRTVVFPLTPGLDRIWALSPVSIICVILKERRMVSSGSVLTWFKIILFRF